MRHLPHLIRTLLAAWDAARDEYRSRFPDERKASR